MENFWITWLSEKKNTCKSGPYQRCKVKVIWLLLFLSSN